MEKIEKYHLQDKVNGLNFTDHISKDIYDMEGSDYILYVKYIDIPNIVNKCSLIIICNNTNYVINNDYRFHHLEITEHESYYEYVFVTLNEKKTNKRRFLNTYFKLK